MTTSEQLDFLSAETKVAIPLIKQAMEWSDVGDTVGGLAGSIGGMALAALKWPNSNIMAPMISASIGGALGQPAGRFLGGKFDKGQAPAPAQPALDPRDVEIVKFGLHPHLGYEHVVGYHNALQRLQQVMPTYQQKQSSVTSAQLDMLKQAGPPIPWGAVGKGVWDFAKIHVWPYVVQGATMMGANWGLNKITGSGENPGTGGQHPSYPAGEGNPGTSNFGGMEGSTGGFETKALYNRLHSPGAFKMEPGQKFGELTGDRKIAFEFGVDLFCKQANFDEEDRASLYSLLEKQGFDPLPAVETAKSLEEEGQFPSVLGKANQWAKGIAPSSLKPPVPGGGMWSPKTFGGSLLGGAGVDIASSALGSAMPGGDLPNSRFSNPFGIRQNMGAEGMASNLGDVFMASQVGFLPGAVLKGLAPTALRGLDYMNSTGRFSGNYKGLGAGGIVNTKDPGTSGAWGNPATFGNERKSFADQVRTSQGEGFANPAAHVTKGSFTTLGGQDMPPGTKINYSQGNQPAVTPETPEHATERKSMIGPTQVQKEMAGMTPAEKADIAGRREAQGVASHKALVEATGGWKPDSPDANWRMARGIADSTNVPIETLQKDLAGHGMNLQPAPATRNNVQTNVVPFNVPKAEIKTPKSIPFGAPRTPQTAVPGSPGDDSVPGSVTKPGGTGAPSTPPATNAAPKPAFIPGQSTVPGVSDRARAAAGGMSANDTFNKSIESSRNDLRTAMNAPKPPVPAEKPFVPGQSTLPGVSDFAKRKQPGGQQPKTVAQKPVQQTRSAPSVTPSSKPGGEVGTKAPSQYPSKPPGIYVPEGTEMPQSPKMVPLNKSGGVETKGAPPGSSSIPAGQMPGQNVTAPPAAVPGNTPSAPPAGVAPNAESKPLASPLGPTLTTGQTL